MNFTNGKPWVATKEQCKFSWGGSPNGELFRCAFCGHKFEDGDTARFQFSDWGKVQCGNFFVCESCDAPSDELIQRMITRFEEAKGKMWFVCLWLSEERER